MVPPVGLKDQDGKLVNLDKFRGKPLVLYFYPADETPTCTKQVQFVSNFSSALQIASAKGKIDLYSSIS